MKVKPPKSGCVLCRLGDKKHSHKPYFEHYVPMVKPKKK
jgi:hypothetical protein